MHGGAEPASCTDIYSGTASHLASAPEALSYGVQVAASSLPDCDAVVLVTCANTARTSQLGSSGLSVTKRELATKPPATAPADMQAAMADNRPARQWAGLVFYGND
ncbi:MAG TPA: hypothetical protein VF469_13800 [Kofleriaceae bacterium]